MVDASAAAGFARTPPLRDGREATSRATASGLNSRFLARRTASKRPSMPRLRAAALRESDGSTPLGAGSGPRTSHWKRNSCSWPAGSV